MRADRAYLAGLGTTGVLLASALLLLAVVSTLVAFRGWPGTDVIDDIGNLVVGEPERRLAVEDGPARIAAQAAPAAGAVAETAAPGTAAATPDPPATTAAPSTPPPTVRRQPPFVPDGGGSRDDFVLREGPPDAGNDGNVVPQPEPLLPDTPVSAQVQRLTSGLGDATQGLTDGLGQAVGGVSPPLAGAVVDTGRLLADLLRWLGQPRR